MAEEESRADGACGGWRRRRAAQTELAADGAGSALIGAQAGDAGKIGAWVLSETGRNTERGERERERGRVQDTGKRKKIENESRVLRTLPKSMPGTTGESGVKRMHEARAD